VTVGFRYVPPSSRLSLFSVPLGSHLTQFLVVLYVPIFSCDDLFVLKLRLFVVCSDSAAVAIRWVMASFCRRWCWCSEVKALVGDVEFIHVER
jgi:hypothetical protein